MEKEVFISYKAEEFDEASWVKQVLENHNISCWMAPSCIPGGSSYASEIPKAIKGCKVFVLILSSRSQASKWVSKEVDLAINFGKTVMPFMLENCDLKDDFNFYLTNVQRYAAYENKVLAAEKMLKEIQAMVGAQNEFTTGSITTPPPSPKPIQEEEVTGVRNDPFTTTPPRPVNIGAIKLTAPRNGEAIALTPRARRTKFGAGGIVGLIFAILGFMFLVAGLNGGESPAYIMFGAAIIGFVSTIITCKNVRKGKRISKTSRGFGVVGLILSIMLMLSIIGTGMKDVSYKMDYLNRTRYHDFSVTVLEKSFDVRVNGSEGYVTYRDSYDIDSDSTCILNVTMNGRATVSNNLLTVDRSNFPSYTMCFNYSSDADVVAYIEQIRTSLFVNGTASQDDIDKLDTLCSFGTITVTEESLFYDLAQRIMQINSIEVSTENYSYRAVAFGYLDGRIEVTYHGNGKVHTVTAYDSYGTIVEIDEYDEWGNLISSNEY